MVTQDENFGSVTKAVISSEAYAALMHIGRSAIPAERLGALIGTVQPSGGGGTVRITRVEPVAVVPLLSGLAPDMDEWGNLESRLPAEQSDPDVILGLYYTDPGLGLFPARLADISETFQPFGSEAKFLLLFNPSTDEGALFMWSGGVLVPVPGFEGDSISDTASVDALISPLWDSQMFGDWLTGIASVRASPVLGTKADEFDVGASDAGTSPSESYWEEYSIEFDSEPNLLTAVQTCDREPDPERPIFSIFAEPEPIIEEGALLLPAATSAVLEPEILLWQEVEPELRSATWEEIEPDPAEDVIRSEGSIFVYPEFERESSVVHDLEPEVEQPSLEEQGFTLEVAAQSEPMLEFSTSAAEVQVEQEALPAITPLSRVPVDIHDTSPLAPLEDLTDEAHVTLKSVRSPITEPLRERHSYSSMVREYLNRMPRVDLKPVISSFSIFFGAAAAEMRSLAHRFVQWVQSRVSSLLSRQEARRTSNKRAEQPVSGQSAPDETQGVVTTPVVLAEYLLQTSDVHEGEVSLLLAAAERAREDVNMQEFQALVIQALELQPSNATAWQMLTETNLRDGSRPAHIQRQVRRSGWRNHLMWTFVMMPRRAIVPLVLLLVGVGTFFAMPWLSSTFQAITRSIAQVGQPVSVSPAPTATTTTSTVETRTFPETGHSVSEPFLDYWERNGGIKVFGYPISPQMLETNAQNNLTEVQYFERARFVLHPEYAGTQFHVQLSLLGLEAPRTGKSTTNLPPGLQGPRVALSGSAIVVPQKFYHFWALHGGLPIFGYPITLVLEDTALDGRLIFVQYFERARLEYHADREGTGNEVEISHLGRQVFVIQYGDK